MPISQKKSIIFKIYNFLEKHPGGNSVDYLEYFDTVRAEESPFYGPKDDPKDPKDDPKDHEHSKPTDEIILGNFFFL